MMSALNDFSDAKIKYDSVAFILAYRLRSEYQNDFCTFVTETLGWVNWNKTCSI